MAISDWSRAKITIFIGLPIFLVVTIPAVIWSYHSETPRLSGDCLHVDQVLRHWAHVLPRVQRALTDAQDPALISDTATAAVAIRDEAQAILDSSLRSTALALADSIDRISLGNPSTPPHGVPDQNYMAGMQGSMSAGHDLKLACPAAGDDGVPE